MQSFFEAGYPYTSNRGALAPPFPDYVENVVLAADTILRVPVPPGAAFVVFSFDGDFRVRLGGAATPVAAPVASTNDGSGSELNPSARRIPARLGDGSPPTHVCLRAVLSCRGSLAFYA